MEEDLERYFWIFREQRNLSSIFGETRWIFHGVVGELQSGSGKSVF